MRIDPAVLVETARTRLLSLGERVPELPAVWDAVAAAPPQVPATLLLLTLAAAGVPALRNLRGARVMRALQMARAPRPSPRRTNALQLARAGASPEQIARSTGLSRDAVALLISTSGSAAAAAPQPAAAAPASRSTVDPPAAPAPTHSAEPREGWQSRRPAPAATAPEPAPEMPVLAAAETDFEPEQFAAFEEVALGVELAAAQAETAPPVAPVAPTQPTAPVAPASSTASRVAGALAAAAAAGAVPGRATRPNLPDAAHLSGDQPATDTAEPEEEPAQPSMLQHLTSQLSSATGAAHALPL